MKITRVLNLILVTLIMTVATKAYAEVPVYEANSVAAMEDVIFNAIQNRETSFKMQFTGNIDNIMSDVKEARDNAVARDPYQEGCIALISGFSVSIESGKADISFPAFQYYTTMAQEEYVTEEIRRIARQIIRTQMTDAQKEKAIHDYVLNSFTYDNSLEGYTAYSALKNGLTVCNGYVQVVYLLAKEAGLETMIVKGKVKNGANWKDHAWNLVKVDEKWYHLDPTLNDTLSNPNNYYNLTDTEIQQDHSFAVSAYPDADTPFSHVNVEGNESTGSGGGPISGTNLVEESIVDGVIKAKLNPAALTKLFNTTADKQEIVVKLTKEGNVLELTIPQAAVINAPERVQRLNIYSSVGHIVLPWDKLNLDGDMIVSASRQPNMTDMAITNRIGAHTVGDVLRLGFYQVVAPGERTPISDLGGYAQFSVKPDGGVSKVGLVGVRYDAATQKLWPVPMVVSEQGIVTFNTRSTATLLILQYNKAFGDMEKHWAKAEVEQLASRLVIQGREPDKFDPQGKVNRAEFAALLVRALGLTDIQEQVNFSDVNHQWYAEAVGIAADAGFVKGYSDGSFRPQATITRQEMAVMIARALDYMGTPTQVADQEEVLQTFADTGMISEWARAAVAQNAVAGIVKGSQSNCFAPDAETTRAEAAVMLVRSLEYAGFMQ